MNVLVVLAHPCADSYNHACAATAVQALTDAGHTVDLIDLYAIGFRAAMSTEERVAYESDEPILDPMVSDHAQRLMRAQALARYDLEGHAGHEHPLQPAFEDRRQAAPPGRVDEDQDLGAPHRGGVGAGDVVES